MSLDLSTKNKQIKTKYIDNTMLGTPTLLNEFKSLAKLLKIVLVDGCNAQIPIAVEVGDQPNIKKIKFNIGFGFTINQVVRVTKDDDSIKEYRVLFADANYIYIDEPDILNLPKEVKLAPLGFTAPYDDIANSGIICFKNNSTTTGILKVIDAVPPNGYNPSWSKFARIVAGQEIDSNGNFINNKKMPWRSDYPNIELTGNMVSGVSGIHGWLKWDYVMSQTTSQSYSECRGDNFGEYPTNWRIVGDDKGFYLFIMAMGRSYGRYNIYSFGKYKSNNINEATNLIVTGSGRDLKGDLDSNGKSGSAWRLAFTKQHDYVGNYIYTTANGQIAANNQCTFFGLNHVRDDSQQQWSHYGGINGINSATGKLITSPMYIKDSSSDLRGELRGIRMLYGTGPMPDFTYINSTKNMILNTKRFNWDSTDNENVPYLFSLEDWE